MWVLLLLIAALPGCSLLFSPSPQANKDAGGIFDAGADSQAVSDAPAACWQSLPDTLHLFSVNAEGSADEPFLDRQPYFPSLSPDTAVFATVPGPQACWDAVQLGPDRSVGILHHPNFRGVNSVDFWFRPKEPGGNSQPLLSKWDGDGFKLALANYDSSARLEITVKTPTSSIAYYTGTPRILEHWRDHWHHVAISFDAGQVQLFFNGELEPNTSDSIGLIIEDNSHDWAWGGGNFVGDLAELRMRTTPITQEQAQAVYQAISPP